MREEVSLVQDSGEAAQSGGNINGSGGGPPSPVFTPMVTCCSGVGVSPLKLDCICRPLDIYNTYVKDPDRLRIRV